MPYDWQNPFMPADPYSDEWIGLPPSATPNTAPPPPSPQLNVANTNISNQPAIPLDPFADYWSHIPASRLAAVAWHPPIFPDAFGQYRLSPPAPRNVPPLDIPFGLLAGIGKLPAARPASWSGILGGLPDPSELPPSLFGGGARFSSAAPPSFDNPSAPFLKDPWSGPALGVFAYQIAPTTDTAPTSPFASGVLSRVGLASSTSMPGLADPLIQRLLSGAHQPNQTVEGFSRTPSNAAVDQSPAAQRWPGLTYPDPGQMAGPGPSAPQGTGGSSGNQQFAQELFLFTRPFIVPRGGMTPLEDLPPGASNGSRSGMDFPRTLGKPQSPEEYPLCTYCGRQTGPGNFHRDHIDPKSRGGNGSEDNYAPSCPECNLQKGARTPREWHNSFKGWDA